MSTEQSESVTASGSRSGSDGTQDFTARTRGLDAMTQRPEGVGRRQRTIVLTSGRSVTFDPGADFGARILALARAPR